MQIEPSLRASDADREQVAQRLRHATAEGRLNADELEERLQTLFAARTYGELDALLADLPAGRPVSSRRRVRVARRAAAVGAFTLMLAALGALALARLHSAAVVVVGGPGAGGRFRFPGPPLRQFGFRPPLGQFSVRPPLADPNHGLIVAASIAAAFAVLLVCGAVLWALMQSRGSVDRPNGPTSRLH